MIRKILSAILIVVSAFAFLAFCHVLDCTRQITETDTDTETESATVGTANAVVWLYLPDVEKNRTKASSLWATS